MQTGNGKHSLEEWHKILSHCNVSDVQKLEAVVDGMNISKKDKFDFNTYLLGKMTEYRSRHPDERVNSDLSWYTATS